MSNVEKKQRELLPDTLNHQSRVFSLIEGLKNIIDTFHSSWKITDKAKLAEGQPEKEVLSTVDEIYQNSRRIEERLEELTKSLTAARANYLGDV